MPRRGAPTALRLHQGPLPTRVDPKHVMPQPPCPSLAPTRPFTRAVASDLPAPAVAPLLSIHFQVATTASSYNTSSSTAAHAKVVAPWDSTRIRHFATTLGGGFGKDSTASSGIAPPKPVVTVKLSSPTRMW